MKVSDAMHAPAEWADADTMVNKIAERMAKDDIGAIPIGKNDKLVGIITDRDLATWVVAKGLDPAKTKAKDVMTKGIIYCNTGETLEDVIHLMDQKQIRRMPVLNEEKRMVGMLSLGDIAHSVGLQLAGELTRAIAQHHK